MPPIKNQFPISLTHLPPIVNKMPQLKKKFQIPLTHYTAPNCPQIGKNATIKETIIILKQFAAVLKICLHFFQICQSQMGLRKELYGPSCLTDRHLTRQ